MTQITDLRRLRGVGVSRVSRSTEGGPRRAARGPEGRPPAVRPSPPLALPARAVFRRHTLVPAAGFPPPRVFAPSCLAPLARRPARSGRRAADAKSALVRSGPRRAGRSGSRDGTGCRFPAAQPSAAPGVDGASIPGGGGDRRRGPAPPPAPV